MSLRRCSTHAASGSAVSGARHALAPGRLSSTRESLPPSERGTLPGATSVTAIEQPIVSLIRPETRSRSALQRVIGLDRLVGEQLAADRSEEVVGRLGAHLELVHRPARG